MVPETPSPIEHEPGKVRQTSWIEKFALATALATRYFVANG